MVAEQHKMILQPVLHNHTSIGVKVKAVFQILSVLVICIWSFHQIQNLQYRSKLTHGSMDLGRKGNAGLNDVVVMDFQDGGITIQLRIVEDGGNTEESSKDKSSKAGGSYVKNEDVDHDGTSMDKYVIGIDEFDDENGIPPGDNGYRNAAGSETRTVGLTLDDNVLGEDNRTEAHVNTITKAEEKDTLSRRCECEDGKDGERLCNEDFLEEMEAKEASMAKFSENVAHVPDASN